MSESVFSQAGLLAGKGVRIKAHVRKRIRQPIDRRQVHREMVKARHRKHPAGKRRRIAVCPADSIPLIAQLRRSRPVQRTALCLKLAESREQCLDPTNLTDLKVAKHRSDLNIRGVPSMPGRTHQRGKGPSRQWAIFAPAAVGPR